MGKYRRKNRKRRFLVFLLMIQIVFILFFLLFATKIRPVISQVTSARAQSFAVCVINDEVNRILEFEDIEYDDLSNLQLDLNNRVSAVTTDIVEINKLKAMVARCIQEKMNDVDKMVIRIPLGTLLSLGVFTGYGPKIPIRLTSVGRAFVDIEDSLTDAGINQTRHEIHLCVKANLSILMPGGSLSEEVKTSIPIAQSVIVGTVPDSFTAISGVDGETKDTVLNLID